MSIDHRAKRLQLSVQWPCAREFGLLQSFALEPVPEIQHAFGVRPVLQPHLAAFAAPSRCGFHCRPRSRFQFSIGRRVRAARPYPTRCRDPQRFVPATPRAAVRSRTSGRSLRTGTARPFSNVEQARGEADTRLVRIADAIRADVAVGAEQLHDVEIRQAGIEYRQLILVAVGRVEVQQPRFECHASLAARATLALERQAGIECSKRQARRGEASVPGALSESSYCV